MDVIQKSNVYIICAYNNNYLFTTVYEFAQHTCDTDTNVAHAAPAIPYPK
jgi:hypothetical protein